MNNELTISNMEFESLRVPVPPARKSKRVFAGAVCILICLAAIIPLLSLRHGISGFTINEEIANLTSYTQKIDLDATKNTEYNLELESIKNATNFSIRALTLSGRYIYNESEGIGNVKVYLEDSEGNRYLILNENALEALGEQEITEEELSEAQGGPSITGMAVEGDSGEGDSSPSESETPSEETPEEQTQEEPADEPSADEETPSEQPSDEQTEEQPQEEPQVPEEQPQEPNGNETQEPSENVTEEINETITPENETIINETLTNETLSNETLLNETLNETLINESEKTIDFESVCTETCDINLNGSDYKLVVEIGSGNLKIDEVKYWIEGNATTSVESELIEDDPRYEVIIDSAEYDNETQTLTAGFHHDYDLQLPISIETLDNYSLNYALSQNSSVASENVTLNVYDWNPDDPAQYFEIKVGEHSEKVGFGKTPEYQFNPKIKNARNENVSANVEFLKGKKLEYEATSLNESIGVKKGQYNIKVRPNETESPIKEIVIENINIEGNVSEFIKIDDVNETGELAEYQEVYAIDPTALNFMNATVTVTAKGSELYKCKDWNFTEQTCYGEWTFLQAINPGENYTFILTPEDPAFGETGQPPTISFVSPTPADSNTTSNNWVYVNASSSDESSQHYALLDWNSSLVSWWRLEETEGTSFADDSGNGNTGSCSNCPTYNSSGQYGAAYMFNGSNMINITDGESNFDALGKNLTISIWFKTTGTSSYQTIIAKGASIGGWFIGMDNTNKVYLSVKKADTADAFWRYTSSTVTDNTFHHLVAILDASNKNITLYLDGALNQGVLSGSGTPADNDNTLTIGAKGTGTPYYFNGSIDEVQVYNRALGLQEIKALYNATANQYYNNFTTISNGNYTFKAYAVDTAGNKANTETRTVIVSADITPPTISFVDPTPADGNTTNNNWVYLNTTITDASTTSAFFDWNNSLLGYWAMDAYNSTGIYDNSSYNNFGTFNGGMNSSNIMTGKFGKALDFDGSNDYLNCGSIAHFERTDPFSVEFWMNWDASGTHAVIANLDQSASTRGWEVILEGSVIHLRLSNTWVTNMLDVSATHGMTTGTWNHVVMNYNGTSLPSGIEIYINGVKKSTVTNYNTLSSTIVNSTKTLSIGSRGWGAASNYFNGKLDEVRVYNRTRSSEEISASYNNTANRLYHNFTNLSAGAYTYKAYAIDTAGNLAETSARTITYSDDTTPPAAVTDLAEQSKSQTWIYWTWTNPSDPDFSEAIVYLNGTWKVNTSDNYYNATDLNDNSSYVITVHTKDTTGNVNNTDVNDTADTPSYNNLPVSTTPSIAPVTAYTNDDLNCTFTVTDDDTGDTLTANYTWYKNGVDTINGTLNVLNGIENSAILEAGNTTKGETWNCSVIPYDGYDYGAEKSAVKTISNSLPTAPVIDVLPNTPEDDNDLAATISVASSDDDNDSVTYAYQWYKNNVSQVGQTSNTLSNLLTSQGETWKCEVTPNDGQGNGAKGEDSVTVAVCTENWTEHYGSCLINDTKLKYYTDQNNCNTTINLPPDNGTYVDCNYCSENITGPFNTSCVNRQLTQYYIDVNYTECCAITDLSSDCHIDNGSYANQTLSCGGGGGGGGGSGGDDENASEENITFAQTFDVSSELKEAGDRVEKTLGKGSGIKFSFDNESHTITFDEISSNAIHLKISSATFYVDVGIGESEKVDVNGNGYYDMEITLKALTATEATIGFELLRDIEKAPQKTGCTVNWSCTNWTECSAEGVQIRACKDLNRCGNAEDKPIEIQDCTPPSCDDKIQNQGEFGIDCGGPCAKRCAAKDIAGSAIEVPESDSKVKIGAWTIVLLSSLVALLFVIGRVENKMKLQAKTNKKENIKKLKRGLLLAHIIHAIIIIAIAFAIFYFIKQS